MFRLISVERSDRKVAPRMSVLKLQFWKAVPFLEYRYA
jgi:hypothetical protein